MGLGLGLDIGSDISDRVDMSVSKWGTCRPHVPYRRLEKKETLLGVEPVPRCFEGYLQPAYHTRAQGRDQTRQVVRGEQPEEFSGRGNLWRRGETPGGEHAFFFLSICFWFETLLLLYISRDLFLFLKGLGWRSLSVACSQLFKSIKVRLVFKLESGMGEG